MDDAQRHHFQELLQLNQRRLRYLEKQAAQYGLSTAPEILSEMSDIRQEITRIEERLGTDTLLTISTLYPEKLKTKSSTSIWTLAKSRKNKGIHPVDELAQGTNAPYRCWRSGSAPAGDRIACGRGVGRLGHGGQEPLQYRLDRALFEDHL
jgi:hypothetical protein